MTKIIGYEYIVYRISSISESQIQFRATKYEIPVLGTGQSLLRVVHHTYHDAVSGSQLSILVYNSELDRGVENDKFIRAQFNPNGTQNAKYISKTYPLRILLLQRYF